MAIGLPLNDGRQFLGTTGSIEDAIQKPSELAGVQADCRTAAGEDVMMETELNVFSIKRDRSHACVSEEMFAAAPMGRRGER